MDNQELGNSEPLEPMSGAFKPQTVSNDDEKKYLSQIKKRNKYLLESLTEEEKQRIADYIIKQYDEAKPSHKKLCEKLDDFDDVSRLVRKEVPGSQGELPNYRLPMSLVAHEVIHANIMNVFFSPKDLMRVIPTAADDISKVNNVSVFGNWSLKNELDIFPKCDQLFHSSEKNGEAVYMLYWKKEYGINIKHEPVLDAQGNLQYDKETQEPIYHEIEEPELVYNAPVMEVIDRRDYIQPADAIMGKKPDWEAHIVRVSYDAFLRDELQGKYYKGSIDKIKDWATLTPLEVQRQDYDGDDLQVGRWWKEHLEWYGRIRITIVEENINDPEATTFHELEDEFIAMVHIKSKTLCSIRKNRFPMKMRPFGVDYFMPDDGNRRAGIGVYELMDSLQKCYDALYDQFMYSVNLSNQPIGFFSPTGNMRDDKIKIQMGYLYPTSDPNSVKLIQFPGPNQSMQIAMQMVQQWAQLLFGISDYAAGMESSIDPDAPAKKAQIIVDQGNVRLNMIIKRKNDVLRDIFKRWYLLYKANMPPNKFMRIAGEGENDDPWKFEAIDFEDFALQSLPDFELTGNILNSNKQLEANKAIAVYQMLSTNIFFNPQAGMNGMQAMRSLTKWLIDKMDDAGLSRFLPQVQNDGIIYSPQEEDATFLQGKDVIPLPGEDHVAHLKVHIPFLHDPATPQEAHPYIIKHIQQTIEMIKQGMGQALQMQNQGIQQQQGMPMGQPQPQQPQQISAQGQTLGGLNGSGTPPLAGATL